ncbi:MAG: type II secretion system protein [Bacillota bacterium]
MMKKLVKNQRGLTLIELLAVVVILGIISAIAIPSIGGMINNSKKDAHIANAQQIANATRLYVTTGAKVNKTDADTNITETDNTITLNELIAEGLLDEIKDPSSDADYDTTETVVVLDDAKNPSKYYVTLVADDTTTIYTPATNIDAQHLKRDEITIP